MAPANRNPEAPVGVKNQELLQDDGQARYDRGWQTGGTYRISATSTPQIGR